MLSWFFPLRSVISFELTEAACKRFLAPTAVTNGAVGESCDECQLTFHGIAHHNAVNRDIVTATRIKAFEFGISGANIVAAVGQSNYRLQQAFLALVYVLNTTHG